jgi:hypothetical protein
MNEVLRAICGLHSKRLDVFSSHEGWPPAGQFNPPLTAKMVQIGIVSHGPDAFLIHSKFQRPLRQAMYSPKSLKLGRLKTVPPS